MELREDQREIAKRLVEVLKSSQWVALQAPTGWGKTLVGLAVIKELGLKPALWLTPRLSIEIHVYNHAVNYFGLKTLATAGKEKMCAFNRSIIDFVKGVCRGCPLNKPVRLGDLQLSFDSLDFGKVREYAEQMGLCPYLLQSVLERRGFDLVIAHYHRANKLVRTIRPRVVVVDESHNLVLPSVHRVDIRAVRLLLEKIGFKEDEIEQLIKSPESLKLVLMELTDELIYVAEGNDELRPIVEELISMFGASIWYLDEADALVALELPELPRIDGKLILMSATLPPTFSGDNVVIIKRGWRIPVKIDTRYALTYGEIQRRKDEISKYIAEKYLTSGTVIFTTVSRELLLNSNEVTWEDELIEKSRTPCDVKDGVLVLRTFGRYNEGIDLGCFQRLIVLGLPLLTPEVMMRLKSRDIDEKNLVVVKTVQLIGRIIRSAERPSQMPEIVLMDRRFNTIRDELANYEIEIIESKPQNPG
jgi:DNA polymerase III delta prime subunit